MLWIPQLKEKWGKDLPQIINLLIVSMCSTTCGLLSTWTSPSIPKLMAKDSTVPMTIEEASYFTIISPIAMIIGAPMFSYLSEKVGRKNALLFISVPYTLAWVLIAVGNSKFVLYISRFLTGLSDVGIPIVLPIYIGEAVTPKVRGTWGNCMIVSVYFGGFLINIIGSYLSIKTTAYVCMGLPLIHCILFMFQPETPYYLIMKGKLEEAKTALMKLRWSKDVDDEFTMIQENVHRQMSEKGTIKDLFTTGSNVKALLILIGLRTIQQLSGLSPFLFYTQYMFQEAGGSISKETSAIAVSGMLFILSLFSSSLMNKMGRRPMMIFSTSGCTIALLIETIYFYCKFFTDINVATFNFVPLLGILLYILMLSSGLGVIPSLMQSELLSASVKGKALGVNNIYHGVAVLIVPKVFQLLTTNFNLFYPFLMFTICTFSGVLFCIFCVPETKMKTLEEIQQDLKQWKLC